MKAFAIQLIEALILSIIILTLVSLGLYVTFACVDWCIEYCAKAWSWS